MSTPKALVLLPSQSDGRRDSPVIVHGHGAPPDDREPVGQRWFTPTSVRFDVATIRTRHGVGCRSGRARHRAATTCYPCRLVAGHLIVQVPFGAGDTRSEHAPSTTSVLKPTAAARWRNDPDGMRRPRPHRSITSGSAPLGRGRCLPSAPRLPARWPATALAPPADIPIPGSGRP